MHTVYGVWGGSDGRFSLMVSLQANNEVFMTKEEKKKGYLLCIGIQTVYFIYRCMHGSSIWIEY